PVGDLVIDRAAGVAERNAAIHAARGLVARRLFAERDQRLAIRAHTVGCWRIFAVAAVDLEKAGYLTHGASRGRQTIPTRRFAPTSPFQGEGKSRPVRSRSAHT